MTTVVLSPPSGPASSPAAVPSSKNVLMAVAVDTKTAKEAAPSETDSPTTTAIDLGLEEVDEMEPEDEDNDENDVRRANGVSDESEQEQRPNKKRRRVFFECADIVEFEPTVYTTSVTSGGVPVGLSLNERSRSRRRLDSFELERETERVGRQNYMEEGYLDPQEREIILNNAGCEEPVIASVEAEVNTIIQHRRESNEIDFDFMYGVGEMEEEVDEEEEEEDTSNVLSFEQDGVAEEVQNESDEEQDNSAEEDEPSAATSDEGSAIEPPATSAESSVHPCSDEVPEAASI